MVTPDEQRALQLANAEADERFWAGQRDMDQATAEDHKALSASAEQAAAMLQAAAADADTKAAIAKERSERIKRGEDVPGGLHKPWTREDLELELMKLGVTKRDIRFWDFAASVPKDIHEEAKEDFTRHGEATRQRAFRAAIRKVLKRRVAAS
jgi:hypothetical protein